MAANASFSAIPLLDLSSFKADDIQANQPLANELHDHLTRVGFVYIAGHAVARELVEAVRLANQRFHALPLDYKNTLALNKNFRGYIAIDTSTIVTSSVANVSRPNQSESLMLMHEVAEDDAAALAGKPLQGPNQWPSEQRLHGFRETIESYVQEMSALARKLLQLIEISLDLPPDALRSHFENPTTFLRLLHYPPRDPEPGLYGAAPHTDYGCITLLAQDDVGGLMVRNREGEWISAPPIPDTFVMNVGDILARWSNDRFVSTPHRVINSSGRERYSQPFFFDPNMDVNIEVLAGCVAAGHERKYEPVVYGDYLMHRIDRNYRSRQQ